MQRQGNSYLSRNLKLNQDRYVMNNNRLGDRTKFSHTVDGKRYFSSLDAEIYFGERFVDEVVNIQWSVSQATMPLFGYNSYTFDDLAVGARQVTGAFTVNFTRAGFLYDILKSARPVERASFFNSDYSKASNLTWSSHFSKEHNASWDRSFNIMVGYGDFYKGGPQTSVTVLVCVQLTGCQQVLDTSGAVIGETYTFIAKDVRYENNLLPERTALEKENPKDLQAAAKNNNFVFKVSQFSISKTSDSNNYVGNMAYTEERGDIKSIHMLLKDERKEKVSSVLINIPLQNNQAFNLDSDLSRPISDIVRRQENLGATSICMYADITIEYSQEGKTRRPLILKNEKINISSL